MKFLLLYLLIALSAVVIYGVITKSILEGFAATAASEPTESKSSGTGIDYPMYIINLDRRTDRLQETVKLLEDKDFDINNMIRMKATDGAAEWDQLKGIVTDDAMVSIYAGFRTEHRQLSKGGVGCYISHLKLWGLLLNEEMREDAIIIFEDDTLPTLAVDEVRRRLDSVPEDWDIVLLGAFYEDCVNVNQHFCRIKRFFGLHAYIIRKKAAKYLVPRALPIAQQIDTWLADLSERNEINVYAMIDSGWVQNERVHSTDVQIPLIDKDDAV